MKTTAWQRLKAAFGPSADTDPSRPRNLEVNQTSFQQNETLEGPEETIFDDDANFLDEQDDVIEEPVLGSDPEGSIY